MEIQTNKSSLMVSSFIKNYDTGTYGGRKVHIDNKSISISKLANEIISSLERGELS